MILYAIFACSQLTCIPAASLPVFQTQQECEKFIETNLHIKFVNGIALDGNIAFRCLHRHVEEWQ